MQKKPILNGIETTKIIKDMYQKEEIEPISIIALTASVYDSNKLPEFMHYFDGIISKPFNFIELQRVIEKAVISKR